MNPREPTSSLRQSQRVTPICSQSAFGPRSTNIRAPFQRFFAGARFLRVMLTDTPIFIAF